MTSRIDIIGSNGPTGDHYKELPYCYGDYNGRFACTNCEWWGKCMVVTEDVNKVCDAVGRYYEDCV